MRETHVIRVEDPSHAGHDLFKLVAEELLEVGRQGVRVQHQVVGHLLGRVKQGLAGGEQLHTGRHL